MSDVIYVGHDAAISFQIFDRDGEPLNLTIDGENIQRVGLNLASTVVDSLSYPDIFDWQTQGARGVVAIDLSTFAFPVGTHGARLIIYSAQYPMGLVVADGYPVRVGEALGNATPAQPDEAGLSVELSDGQKGSDLVAWRGSGFTVTQGLDGHTGELDEHHGRLSTLETAPEKALVSATDTTPGFLSDKLVAGADITLTSTDAGSDEKLEIAVSGRDHKGALVFVQMGQVPNYAWTAINFSNTVYDMGDFFDVALSQSRLTIPAGVTKVRVSTQITFERNLTGTRDVRIYKNGAVYSFIDPKSSTGGTENATGVQVTSPIIEVVEGDYFEVFAFQNSGAALYKEIYGNWFSIETIR
jgi:hypothetical protein